MTPAQLLEGLSQAGGELEGQAGAVQGLRRGPRPVGGQLKQRVQPCQALAPVGQLPRQAWVLTGLRALPRREVAVLYGHLG